MRELMSMFKRGCAVLLLISASACGGNSTPTSPSSSTSTPATPTRIIGLSGNLAFGNVTVGQSATTTLTITNSGNSTLTVSGMTITSGLETVFSPSWTSGTIAAGGSQQVINQYTPTVAQSYSGTVTVNGDQTSGTNTIAISGTASAPTPTPAPTPAPPPSSTRIESVIDGTFEGWTGETVFALANGQYWQQTSYSYVYHYAYRPKVVITWNGSVYVLSVEGLQQTINVQPLQSVIRSNIDGTFEGWTGDTVFPLTNGQVWQQSSYAYTYHYAYRPEVLIYSATGSSSSYKMQVEGVSSVIAVRRIR